MLYKVIPLALLSSIAFAAPCPDPLPSNTVCFKWTNAPTLTDGSPATGVVATRLYLSASPITLQNQSDAQMWEVPISETEYVETGDNLQLPLLAPGASGTFRVYARASHLREVPALDENRQPILTPSGQPALRRIEGALGNEVMQTVQIINITPDVTPPGSPTMIHIRISIPGQG